MVEPVEYLEAVNAYRNELLDNKQYDEVVRLDDTVYAIAMQLGWHIETAAHDDIEDEYSTNEENGDK